VDSEVFDSWKIEVSFNLILISQIRLIAMDSGVFDSWHIEVSFNLVIISQSKLNNGGFESF
jgi:hypothetical protein